MSRYYPARPNRLVRGVSKGLRAMDVNDWQPLSDLIGIGATVTRRPVPHHGAYGSVHGGSSQLRYAPSIKEEGRASRSSKLDSPAERALARGRYHGPSAPLAVCLASCGRTPSASRAPRQRRHVLHCRKSVARSRRRTQPGSREGKHRTRGETAARRQGLQRSVALGEIAKSETVRLMTARWILSKLAGAVHFANGAALICRSLWRAQLG
jgi:hypothetical protein